MSDAPATEAQTHLGAVLSRHVVFIRNSAGTEHVPGVREAGDTIIDQLRAAIAAAEDAANGSLNDASQEELRRLLDTARTHLHTYAPDTSNEPEEPDKPQVFLDHNRNPCDPRKYARDQLGIPDLEALVARPEDTRTLYALERTGGRRIPIGEAKDVRSLTTMANRLWDFDLVPRCSAKHFWAVQHALLCIKRVEPGVTADEITRGWLAHHCGTNTPTGVRNLDDRDERAELAGASNTPPPGAAWVTGGNLGTQQRLLVHSGDLEAHVRRALAQQIARGSIAGRLRALNFERYKVRDAKTSHDQEERPERRYWISPEGFTLGASG